MPYFDHHATTPVDPRVVEAMLPYFTERFGNPSSRGHRWGEEALAAVEQATATIAASIGAHPQEIIYTSGATESNNLALRGVAQRARQQRTQLMGVTTEHDSVLKPLQDLARQGHQLTLLEVEPAPSPRAGWLDPQKVQDAMTDETLLLSVMLANNEIGVIQPLAEIGEICQKRGALLHCDATQAIGKLPIDLRSLPIDLLSFSAHKFYGPPGVGGLYVRQRRPRIRLAPQILGGGQQAGRRSGTLNTPGIVGMARALELCLAEMSTSTTQLAAQRNRLWEGLTHAVDDLVLCGPALDARDRQGQALRLPHNLNISFGNVDGEALLLAVEDLAVSSGASCASSSQDPSHVLLALGLGADQARSSLRFGLGRWNTDQEIDQAVASISQAAHQLRKLASR